MNFFTQTLCHAAAGDVNLVDGYAALRSDLGGRNAAQSDELERRERAVLNRRLVAERA
ncbi:MAG: hypothetical protein QM783_02955 [Phycisphaerales bacterium]